MSLTSHIKSHTNTEDSQQHKIRVIAFDYGKVSGVLFHDGKQRAVDKLKKEHGYDGDIIWKLMTSPESWDLRRGNICSNDFWKWAQEQLPKGYDSQLICDTWCNEYIMDKDILDLLRRLKGHNYRIISYTDGIPERVEYLENKYHFRHYFDAEVQSSDWQAVKTDEAFAQALLKTAECETDPDALLLIDDQEDEVQHVKKLGANVILYKTGFHNELVNALRNIGIQC
ncbi:unnamed protein product [Adineta steineri]|uniref:Uncharacterized protein n=1 Tax=Adineta steineri TaxID=433720 RepID=A0A818V4M0_9BILA|nr:unnamed protein product [Adineta steineri]CAF3707527.1 unnamed protein product [Adineta steineri]